MKPQDLKLPFVWDSRRVLVNDRVWYVPQGVQSEQLFEFPGWDHPDLFGNVHPVCIEYCSGNGAWVAAKALQNPHINWVAVERKYARVRKIWAKIKKMELKNLLVVAGEGHYATQSFFPQNSITGIYINFPDPWPKNRHAKHRLIQEAFVKEMWRVLKEDSSLTFVTDDTPYSNWFIEVMLKEKGFTSTYPNPYYETEHVDYGTSYFDELWRSKGRLIRYHCFKKV